MATLKLAIDARQAKNGAVEFKMSAEQVNRAARQAADGTDHLNNRTKAMGGTAVKVRRLLGGLFVGLGAVAAIRQGTKVIIGYEASMAELKTVIGATDDEMKLLMGTARELGATTRFTAAQTADAMTILARMGFSVSEAIATVGPVLTLAVNQTMAMSEAAQITAGALRQFQMEAGEATRVVDVLTLTANSAGTNVIQMGEAFKMVGPVAGALGFQIEEMSAIVGVLGDRMILGSQAGTNLRGIIAGLLETTDKGAAAMAEMGLEVEDLSPATHTLTEIFKKLAAAEMTAAQATAIFGRRNFAAALALRDSTDRVEELTEANFRAAGSAQAAADVMDNTLKGAILSLKSAWEELMLQTGEGGAGGSLRFLVDTMTGALRIFAGLEEHVTKNKRAAMGLVLGVELLIGAFVILKSQALISYFVGLSVSIGGAATSVGLLHTAALMLISAFAGWKIGTYLESEFKIVQQAAANMVANLLMGWEWIKFGAQAAWVAVGHGWEMMVFGVVKVFTFAIGKIADGLGLLETLAEKIGVDLGDSSDRLRTFADESLEEFRPEEFASKIGALTEERKKANEFWNNAAIELMGNIEEDFGGDARKGESLIDSVTGVVEKQKASMETLKDLLKESDRAGSSASDGIEAKQRAQGTAQIEKMFKTLRVEQSLIGKTNDERERAYELIKLQEVAEKTYGAETEKTIKIMGEYEDQLEELQKAREMEDIANSMASSFGNAFASMVTGAASASDAFRSLASDILKIMSQKMISEPLANAFMSVNWGGMFGGGGGGGNINMMNSMSTGTMIAHNGLSAYGSSGTSRNVSSSVFSNAPRLHDGLAPDEFPAILQQGEEVRSKKQVANGRDMMVPDVEVRIINESGNEVKGKNAGSKFDGRKMITTIILEDISQYGPIRNAFQGMSQNG